VFGVVLILLLGAVVPAGVASVAAAVVVLFV